MNMNLGYTQLILDECREYGCLRNQAAYILATAYWETARTMKPVEEAYWVKNADAWRKKNLRYYPWHGRGFVQLTWEANYKKAEKETGIQFSQDPTLAFKPEPAATVLVKGSMEGWFTGKKIGDYITLQTSDFKGARRVINGTDKAAKIAAIATRYDNALEALGYGTEDAVEPDVMLIPVEPEGVDKPMAQSKTTWISTILGGIGSALAFVSGLHPIVQGLIVVAVIGGAVYIIKERKRFRDEARSIKEELGI